MKDGCKQASILYDKMWFEMKGEKVLSLCHVITDICF